MLAKSAGGLPESIAPPPLTVSPASTSTDSGSPPQKPSKNSTTVEGMVCGLAALVVIGIGAWVFLRERAAARINTSAPMSQHGHGVPQLPPYVRLLAFWSVCALTNILRTDIYHPHFPPTLTIA